MRDPKTGESRHRKLKTQLLDSETGKAIEAANAVIILARSGDYLPDSGGGTPKRPKIIVRRFDEIDKLTLTNRGLGVWPFFAIGTLHVGTDVFIYKKGYLPVVFKKVKVNSTTYDYPETIKMIPCSQSEGKELLITLALQKVREDKWKEYTRVVLEKHLRWGVLLQNAICTLNERNHFI